jgi:hypothetical protein
MNPFKRIRSRIRSENIRTIFIPVCKLGCEFRYNNLYLKVEVIKKIQGRNSSFLPIQSISTLTKYIKKQYYLLYQILIIIRFKT